MKANRLLALFVLLLLLVISGWAAETGRKKRKDVRPTYPEIARKMNLRGVVTLELTISPEGKVREIKVLGGNPVLAEAAKEAAQNWLYEPASSATVETVRVDFQ